MKRILFLSLLLVVGAKLTAQSPGYTLVPVSITVVPMVLSPMVLSPMVLAPKISVPTLDVSVVNVPAFVEKWAECRAQVETAYAGRYVEPFGHSNIGQEFKRLRLRNDAIKYKANPTAADLVEYYAICDAWLELNLRWAMVLNPPYTE